MCVCVYVYNKYGMCLVHNFMNEGVPLRNFLSLSSTRRLELRSYPAATNPRIPPWTRYFLLFFRSHHTHRTYCFLVALSSHFRHPVRRLRRMHPLQKMQQYAMRAFGPLSQTANTQSRASWPPVAGIRKRLREQCKRNQRRPTQYKSKTTMPPEVGTTYILKRICTERPIPHSFAPLFQPACSHDNVLHNLLLLVLTVVNTARAFTNCVLACT